MSDIIVEIVKIDEIHDHPNADKMEIAIIKGWTCCVPINKYKAGDHVIFVPPECMLPLGFIERHGITYLKNKSGRVGVVKLRQVYSEGIVCDNLDNLNLGMDVAKKYGITKWEEPSPSFQMSGKGQRTKRRVNVNFKKYTEIKNFKHFPNVIQSDDMVIITEKIHGCVPYFTRITMVDGSQKKICQIKVGDWVLGMNNDGDITPTEVLNTFKNGRTDKWVYLKGKRSGVGPGGDPRISLPLTDNHPVWLSDKNKFKPAGEFKVNNKILMLRHDLQLTPIQKQILIGKMIGDGSLSRIKHSANMNISHKEEHSDYLEWCLKALGDMGSNWRGTAVSGYGSKMVRGRSINSFHIKQYFQNWYENNKVVIPKQLIEDITPIGIAVWYMDDGSLSHSNSNQENGATFNSCSFSKKDHKILLKCLNKFNIKGEYYTSQNYGRIRINSDDAEMLFLLIALYIPKVMQYKLPKRYRTNRDSWLPTYENSYKQTKVSQVVTKIEIKVAKPGERVRYNIETGTNNYFANKILVSNSNFRAGHILRPPCKSIMSYVRYVWDFIRGRDLKYEFCVGSHNVQLQEQVRYKGFYKRNVYRHQAETCDIKNKLPQGYQVFGEIYGGSIQKNYGYDLELFPDKVSTLFYEVMFHGQYCSPLVSMNQLKNWGLPFVPYIYYGCWKHAPSPEEMFKNRSALDEKTIIEGAVVSLAKPREEHGVGRVILKIINPEYLAQKERTEHK